MGGSLIGVESKPKYNPYRPPPGFMDDKADKDSGSAEPDVEDPQVKSVCIARCAQHINCHRPHVCEMW